MTKLITVVAILLLATSAWADLGLPNELSDPGFETGGVWATTGGVSNHLPYSMVAPCGVPACPGGGSYGGGYAGISVSFGGGLLSQVVDESQFPGWLPNGTSKTVSVDYTYFASGAADVPMLFTVYLSYMQDGSMLDPQSPLYVRQAIDSRTGNSGGWVARSKIVDLPTQPRFLSLDFQLSYFSGTGVMLFDKVNLQGKCVAVPEPGSMLALVSGLIGLGGLALRRRK